MGDSHSLRVDIVTLCNRPEIEFKLACDVMEAVEFGKMYGFYDVRRTHAAQIGSEKVLQTF